MYMTYYMCMCVSRMCVFASSRFFNNFNFEILQMHMRNCRHTDINNLNFRHIHKYVCTFALVYKVFTRACQNDVIVIHTRI